MTSYWETAKQGVCRAVAFFGGPPRLVATAASITAVGLALKPGGFLGGEYNAELAVLTATLVALIWYAFFTFRISRPRSRADFGLDRNVIKGNRKPHFVPQVQIENPLNQPLRVQLDLRIWVAGEKVPLGPFYSGERWFTLGAERRVFWTLRLDKHLSYSERDDHGDCYILEDAALIACRVRWIDNLCESNASSVQHWHVPLKRSGKASPVMDPVRIEDLFGPLDGSFQ